MLNSIARFFEIGTCLNCGSFLNTDLRLCEFCSEKILSPYISTKTNKTCHGLTVRSLFDWKPFESDEFSKWVVTSKKAAQRTWNSAADVFIRQNISEITQFDNCILIPCPYRNPRRDHAQKWARGLSRHLSGPVLELLKFESNSVLKTQKQRRKADRAHLQLSINEKITQNDMEQTLRFNERKIIFIDDIVTTGSTAWAAYLALGKPVDFEVWCLTHRLSLRLS